ncbi:MAG: MATE family efflux transporter, partial [Muribaculaceae bacterium]|nr:MATE family efflux transporter [Muribaculaceae bacterium]
RCVRRILIWAAAIAAVFFVVYVIGYRGIIGLITDRPQVIDYACTLHWFIILIPPVTVAAFVFDGFFIGLTATRSMLVVTLASAIVFFSICFIHLTDGTIAISLPSNTTLWTAFLLYLLCRGLFLALLTPRSIRSAICPAK